MRADPTRGNVGDSGTDLNANQKASRALEALVIKQMLKASGVFRGNETAGSAIHADMFADILADTVANAGGMGFSTPLEPPIPAANQRALSVSPRIDSSLSPNSLVPSGRVTSDFGARIDPLDGRNAIHSGVDIAASEGTAILAAADGVVRRAGARGGYGISLELDHGGVSTLYGHASELLVSEGERVVKGQPIARVGKTGRATGSHLHFEVRVGEHPVSPLRALKAYATCADEKVGLK